jgi:uncharacterized protein (TIGR02246 family)
VVVVRLLFWVQIKKIYMVDSKNPALRLVISLTCVVALSWPTIAQERSVVPDFRTYGEPDSVADGARVEALIQGYKNAWGQQDTEAFIALHANDVEWINAYARIFQDSESLASFIEHRLFPAFDSEVSRQEIANIKVVSIRYVGDDAAVVHMYTDGQRGGSRNEGEDMRRTHIHLVLENQQPGWTIVHTAIMDAR